MKRKNHWKDEESRALLDAILSLKTRDEAERFFRDLCTPEELDEFARRWQAARLLAQRRPYREVADEAGVSTTTVSRVAHWLHQGKGGYELVLRRLRL